MAQMKIMSAGGIGGGGGIKQKTIKIVDNDVVIHPEYMTAYKAASAGTINPVVNNNVITANGNAGFTLLGTGGYTNPPNQFDLAMQNLVDIGFNKISIKINVSVQVNTTKNYRGLFTEGFTSGTLQLALPSSTSSTSYTYTMNGFVELTLNNGYGYLYFREGGEYNWVNMTATIHDLILIVSKV